MATWDVDIIFEETGDYVNVQYETDTVDQNLIFDEILGSISIVPTLVDED